MKNNIYIKIVQDYGEISKTNKYKALNKIIFIYKNLFNIVTIKKEKNIIIGILPITKEKLNKRIEKIIYKLYCKGFKKYKLVLSNELMRKDIIKLFDKYNLDYYKGLEIKKHLLFNIIDYINLIQNKQLYEREITVLINDISEFNKKMLFELAKHSKSLKIVTKNIYKFRNIEEQLYNEYGIAIQLSNSYRKSLLKSEIIINIDFYETEINAYKINNKAIIINLNKNIKIASKLFNGIVVNSINLRLKKEIKTGFVNINKEFDELILAESIMEKLDVKKIKIDSLIGNNRIISKTEIKNLKLLK